MEEASFETSLESEQSIPLNGSLDANNAPSDTEHNELKLDDSLSECAIGSVEEDEEEETVTSPEPMDVLDPSPEPDALSAHELCLVESSSNLPFHNDPSSSELPECRTKRSYLCGYCNMKTLNPREYLYHLKDAHGELHRIFECDQCMYASKSLQKLTRHNYMVHKVDKPAESGAKKSPAKKPMVTIPKKSLVPMNRSPREAKSPRRFEEYEFTDDLQMDLEDTPLHIAHETCSKKQFKCSECDFVAQYAKVLTKHELKCHVKKTLYECHLCKYVTHVKARFTKHIKYHKLNVVKCDHCDFRTPYRWNLDRHMKNHSRQGGDYKCHLCNFQAHIKQSLTVHIANHHHDSHLHSASKTNDEHISEEEMELLRMERDEDEEALSFTVSTLDTDELDQQPVMPPTALKKPNIKMTFKKMKPNKQTAAAERHNFEEDFVHPDDVVHRNGNVYLKTQQCHQCPFKAPFQSELQKHVNKFHSSTDEDPPESCLDVTIKTEAADEEFAEDSYMETSNENLGETTLDASPKKKTSFFDKNIYVSSTNVENLVCQFCGHESKCLSESVRHQKLHLSAKNIYASSTVCQFCRHRCKTADDLVNHLKCCNEARKNQMPANDNDKPDAEADIKHPMENKVFVWTQLESFDEEPMETDENASIDASVSHDTTADGDSLPKKTKKVYRCPHCNFMTGTPSRFHVHIVGHYNKKPYSCSDCGYCSNWRWDITKHIKLKISRKDRHKGAEVLVSDIVNEKNYDKYDKYVSIVAVEKKRTSKDSNPTKRKLKAACDSPKSHTIPAPPKLTRAPARKPSVTAGQKSHASSPAAVDINSNQSIPFASKPPPLVAMGSVGPGRSGLAENEPQQTDPQPTDDENTASTNYQIITAQGAMNTNLETLQMLASGSPQLDLLKTLQKKSEDPADPGANVDAFSQQMRMLLWLNCLSREAEQKDGDKDAPPNSRAETMEMQLDHEGNPEWKCTACDFRDNEEDTVVQHVRLAHSDQGPVSLVHAVHRCNTCGFAAGTKRHVQLHIDTAHEGRGEIISRSEGQAVKDENAVKSDEKVYNCRLCPFTSRRQKDLKAHSTHHTPRVGYVLKCMYCPYYVQTQDELIAHLVVHGPNQCVPSVSGDNTGVTFSASQDDSSPRPFVCGLCPFETHSRPKLVHHRQFHRPRDLPYHCPHCSYNVTRRHMLQQHLKVHGVTDLIDEACLQAKTTQEDPLTGGSKSPSPSLTITPIATTATTAKQVVKAINPACLPTLSDELTKNLRDIPLVWVSRDTRFFKMFKCRHCPHVNLRKTNIQEHEKMHIPGALPPGVGHACQFCSYISANAGVMTSHMKVHSGSLGKCHAIVDQALPNQEQLHMLAGTYSSTPEVKVEKSDEKLLYYCQHCPARFFYEKEVIIHSRFHSTNNFSHQCEQCNYSVRDPQQLMTHFKVHTLPYQERTRTLMTMHPSAPSYMPVAGNSVTAEVLNVTTCNVINSPAQSQSDIRQPPPTSRFKCDKCPSTFTKLVTLQYHQSLHSADNPFKCNRCTYAAKTQLGLDQHLALHVQAELEQVSASYSVDSSPPQSPSPSKSIQETLSLLSGSKKRPRPPGEDTDQPPIKLRLSLKGDSKKQFKYYIEEQVPLSGIGLLKRKNQLEREMPKDANPKAPKNDKPKIIRAPRTEDRVGNPAFHYPMHIDKVCGKTKEKRYKCIHCPSAFEKLDQFNVHINLHGSNYKYKCRMCDYTVKFFANFMMHIKRHKYHERMDAQVKGQAAPEEDDPKFQPVIGVNPPVVKEDPKPKVDCTLNKENHWDDTNVDMTMSEKQHLLLQEKKGAYMKYKEDETDKKVFYCQHCPYANVRRDGVDSHSLRHVENHGRGVYNCNFCDYTASQPNFIREHTKVHFRPFKYVQPEGFMRHDKLEIWSICSQDTSHNGSTSKKLVLGHEDGQFSPLVQLDVDVKMSTDQDDSFLDSGISVDFRNADIIDAPAHMK